MYTYVYYLPPPSPHVLSLALRQLRTLPLTGPYILTNLIAPNAPVDLCFVIDNLHSPAEVVPPSLLETAAPHARKVFVFYTAALPAGEGAEEELEAYFRAKKNRNKIEFYLFDYGVRMLKKGTHVK
jgi:hypothetical protein